MIRRNRPFTIEAQALFRFHLDGLYGPGALLDVCLPSGKTYPVRVLDSEIDRKTGAMRLRVKRARSWWRVWA